MEGALTPPPLNRDRNPTAVRCNSKSPLYPGCHGFETCWGEDGHPERIHTAGSRAWTDPPEVDALARVVEAAWGDPRWDGRTLRPVDRRIARAVLEAGYKAVEHTIRGQEEQR